MTDFVYLGNSWNSTASRVGRIIKPSGARIMTIMAEEPHARAFFEAAEDKKIGREGYGIISGEEGAWVLGSLTPSSR
jgi:hypothetical protein